MAPNCVPSEFVAVCNPAPNVKVKSSSVQVPDAPACMKLYEEVSPYECKSTLR